MSELFLYLILSVFLVQHARAGQDIPEACRDYIQENSQADDRTLSEPDSIPHGRGLLWKIEDVRGRQSHLFGTMHSQDRRVTSLAPPVRLALAQSRIVLLELVPDEEARRYFSEAVYSTTGATLNSLLNREIFDALVHILPHYGIEEKNAGKLKPWAAFTLIGQPRPVRAATQDEVLMRMAVDMGKAITGLESMQELVETLDGLDLPDQIEIVNDTVCNHARILRNTRNLVDLYVERDLAGIVRFNEQPHHDEAVFARFMQRIVYDRNLRILDRMENHLRNGNAFISIGALHLPGDKGLLRLLEMKGYMITQVY